jgi:hypothetical protein
MPTLPPLNQDQESPATDAAREPQREAGAALPTRRLPLGEELPIFCERCGYCLHGMAQHVCELCTVRQFHCPECGHHQPINTLRPAVQKILGRIRAFFIILSLLFKICFFGWLLFGWVMMGYEWSYDYLRGRPYVIQAGPGGMISSHQFGPRELDLGQFMAFGLFGLLFGTFGRMLLLRWRSGLKVGLVLAALVCVAVSVGAMWRKLERQEERLILPQPFTSDFLISITAAFLSLVLGASIVWGVWTALAHIFLPRRTSEALLEWQRSQSNPAAAVLGRD